MLYELCSYYWVAKIERFIYRGGLDWTPMSTANYSTADIRRDIKDILSGNRLPKGTKYWNGLEPVRDLVDYRLKLSLEDQKKFDHVIISDYLDAGDESRVRFAVQMTVGSKSPDCIDSIVEKLSD